MVPFTELDGKREKASVGGVREEVPVGCRMKIPRRQPHMRVQSPWTALSWNSKTGFKIDTSLLVAQRVKNLPPRQETQVQFLDWEDPLGREMAAHSSVLAWKIPEQRSLVGYSPWGCKESDITE